MVEQIRVSPETLQSRAREYGKASNEITQILNNVQRLQDTLRSEWKVQLLKVLIINLMKKFKIF